MIEDVEVSRSLMKRMKSTGGDDGALGCTSIDGMQIGEEAVHSDGIRPIKEETINPFIE